MKNQIKNLLKVLFILAISIYLGSCQKNEELPSFTLTASVNQKEAGILKITPNQKKYEKGTKITIIPQPTEGWVFQKWEGGETSNANPLVITINNSIQIKGVFIKKDITPITIGDEFTLTEVEYSIHLKWKYNPNTRIKKVEIHRGTTTENIKLFASINQTSNSEFTDKSAGVRTELFYRINYLLTDDTKSNSSKILSKSSKEPINTGVPKNGEIGGIHYAFWKFNSQTFNRIRHKFTIHDEPSNGDALYYQFYQGILNDTIGFYYGIQTHVTSPTGNHKKGLIFSRWGTRDPNNYKTAPGGWGESAGYEGDFIGIRKNYEWTVGEYETDLKKDSSDVKGDWYSLHIRKLPNQFPVYIGSIRFEKSDKSSGIKSDGITWTELYWKKIQNSPLPSWHVSINDVTVNTSEKPKQVYTTYNPNKFLNFTNIFTITNSDVHFIMGPKVLKFHPEGDLWK